MSAATIQPTTHSSNAGLSSPHPSETHHRANGSAAQGSGGERVYLVSSFQSLKGGHLFMLELRVAVAQPIEWVRAHAEEIARRGIQQDRVASKLASPIVALNVAEA